MSDNELGSADVDFTSTDHIFRAEDHYARLKYELTLESFLKQGLQRGQLIVNFGSGAGDFNQLAAAAGFRVLGIEPDTNAYEMSLRYRHELVEVRNSGIFDDIDLPAADAVVMHDVLEHIADDRAAVAAALRVLVPGGLLFISVPALNFLYGRHDELLGHYRRYSRSQVRALVPSENKVIMARYIGLLGVPYVFWTSRIRRRNYSVISGGRSVVTRIFRLVCRLEKTLRAPVGTSVLLVIRKKG